MFYVYILANKHNSVLYTGFTDDLERRLYEHKIKFYPNAFTAKYNVDRLLYYEEFEDKNEALHREKQLKRYHRKWKTELIEVSNPKWLDLADEWFEDEGR